MSAQPVVVEVQLAEVEAQPVVVEVQLISITLSLLLLIISRQALLIGETVGVLCNIVSISLCQVP